MVRFYLDRIRGFALIAAGFIRAQYRSGTVQFQAGSLSQVNSFSTG